MTRNDGDNSPSLGAVAALPGTGAATAPDYRRWRSSYVQRLRVSDTLIVIAVIVVAQMLRFGGLTSGNLAGPAGPTSVDYLVVSVSIAAVWVAALSIYRTRAPQIVGTGLEEYRRVWTATLSLFGVIAVVSTIFRLDIARGYLAIALRNPWCVLPVTGYQLVGVCAPRLPRDRMHIPVIGDVSAYPYDGDIASAVLRSGADTVVLTSGHLDPDEIRALSWQLETMDVELVVSLGMVDIRRHRRMSGNIDGRWRATCSSCPCPPSTAPAVDVNQDVPLLEPSTTDAQDR